MPEIDPKLAAYGTGILRKRRGADIRTGTRVQAIESGRVAAWIGKGESMPSLASAVTMTAGTPSSANEVVGTAVEGRFSAIEVTPKGRRSSCPAR